MFARFLASMGPPPFGSGNCQPGRLWIRVLPASMGPPPFGSGNERYQTDPIYASQASMGPLPFGSGNRRNRGGHRHVYRASMGPLPFGSGNAGTPLQAQSSITLQWGHCLSAVETLELPFRRNQALRFNGATDFRQWKRWNSPSGAIKHYASMGPLTFGSGNAAFSGGFSIGAFLLQWGHCLSAVETRLLWIDRPPHFLASMGPLPFGSGNEAVLSYTVSSMPSFNGATAFRQWKLRQ